MEVFYYVRSLMILFVHAQIAHVSCESGLIIFNFPRTIFMEFFDSLVKSRHNIAHHDGVVEVLSYQLFTIPHKNSLQPGWTQTRCLCVISFRKMEDAKKWTSEDPLVQQKWTWSHGLDINILRIQSSHVRNTPYTRDYGSHIMAMVYARENKVLENEILPHFRDLFMHHGGREHLETSTWQTISGKSWPPEGSNWLFYGPLPTMKNATELMRSKNMELFLWKYSNVIMTPHVYAAYSFFNAGNNISNNGFTMTILSLVIALIANRLYS